MNKYQVNDIIEGTVIEIKSYGAILLFNGEIKGLLHISEIANSYIPNIRKFLSIGCIYQVKVLSVENNGFLRVSIAKISEEERKKIHSPEAKKRTPVKEEDIDFSPIKEKMPIWIKEFEEKHND